MDCVRGKKGKRVVDLVGGEEKGRGEINRLSG